MGSKGSSPGSASPEILIAPPFAQAAPSNTYWCARELQVWPYSPEDQTGVISALSGTSEAGRGYTALPAQGWK